MLQSVVFRPNAPAFSYPNLRAHRGFAFDEKETSNEFPFKRSSQSHQSLHHISPNDFTIISSCRSNSNFQFLRERAYWYGNIDPLSTKTYLPYRFLYFGFTRPPFHCAFDFILFYLYFLVTLHFVTLIPLVSFSCYLSFRVNRYIGFCHTSK